MKHRIDLLLTQEEEDFFFHLRKGWGLKLDFVIRQFIDLIRKDDEAWRLFMKKTMNKLEADPALHHYLKEEKK